MWRTWGRLDLERHDTRGSPEAGQSSTSGSLVVERHCSRGEARRSSELERREGGRSWSEARRRPERSALELGVEPLGEEWALGARARRGTVGEEVGIGWSRGKDDRVGAEEGGRTHEGAETRVWQRHFHFVLFR